MALTKFHQYACEVQVKMPHLAFRQSNEIHMQQMLWRKVSRDRHVDCLPMWYYFYCVDFDDPLTVLQHESGDVELHPGQNRFIGRSILGDAPWKPARIITINREWQYVLNGIRNVTLLDTREFEYETKFDFYRRGDLYIWSHGSYAPTANNWLEMPEQWAQERLVDWGGKLHLHGGRTHYINRSARKWIVARVTEANTELEGNHASLRDACRWLFQKLESKQNKQARKNRKQSAKR